MGAFFSYERCCAELEVEHVFVAHKASQGTVFPAGFLTLGI